jgi:hypothetical protein
MQTAMSAATLSQTSGFFAGSLFSTYFCAGFKTWVHFGISIWALISYCVLILKHLPKLTNVEGKLENVHNNLAMSKQSILTEVQL